MNRTRSMSGAIVRRMPRYWAAIQLLKKNRCEWISSEDLAHMLGFTSATVRHDFMYLDCSGVSKRGYHVEEVCEALAGLLGMKARIRAAVVGAGPLGRSLIGAGASSGGNFSVCGIFDPDPKTHGEKIGRLRVRGMETLSEVVRDKKVEVGIIAVEPANAQGVADKLVLAGARGLLNLTPTNIVAPKQVAVLNGGVGTSLMELYCLMRDGIEED